MDLGSHPLIRTCPVLNLTAPILVEGRWEVREMVLDWEKVEQLWNELQPYKTLFSDLTRGDFENFVKVLTNPNTLWFEVWEEKIIGLVWLADIEQVVDATAHMVFFDRQPMEKVPVCRALIRWVFARYPLHRVSVTPPELYHATHRLVERIGFKREGVKREAVLIGGKWNDMRLYGLTRSDVEAMP